ncbi:MULTISPECIES: DUF6223 family protein [unclassified Micromonospora]|uniref:DUF6223 family protein n=1 Tax=unclassified Micromonospora TaxID=2617518 RepID=UPI001C604EC1|nr:DUF6223 family protein [Micromonospora sp. RL09-050-HVF-A]MBW4700604.1 hypothetical protein [Micromonospora sp. RL09-050-HVF-A]
MRAAGNSRASRLVSTTVTAAVLGGTWFAAPASAHPSARQAAVDVTTMSAGRLGATLAALLGLAGLVIGGLALGRPTVRPGGGRRGAVLALTAGVVGTALGALVVATSDSGIGTGNGRGGGYLALVLGLLAVGLGGLALTRSRRAG